MRSKIVDFLLGNDCSEEKEKKDKELLDLRLKLKAQKKVLMTKAGELCSTARKMHKKETDSYNCSIECTEEKKIA
jgi:hypothetical protein